MIELALPVQLKKLRAEAEQSQRKEAAAKAVLAAAKDAAREGRALSKDERSAVEWPILYPEQAQEKPAAPQAVRCSLYFVSCTGLSFRLRTPARVGRGCDSQGVPHETFLQDGFHLSAFHSNQPCRMEVLALQDDSTAVAMCCRAGTAEAKAGRWQAKGSTHACPGKDTGRGGRQG